MFLCTALSWVLLADPSQAAGPANTLPPTISGTPMAGATLTEAHGSWIPAPASYSYQWERCSGSICTAIAGATNQTYTLTSADASQTIVVQESATNAGGTGGPANSAPTAVVTLPPLPSNTALPTIFGVAELGQTLVDAHGSWNSPTPFTYSYQWADCDSSGTHCTAIAAATNQVYTLTAADVGHTVLVQESATNAGGTGGPANSAPTAVVTLPPPPSSTAPPRIFGVAAQGQTLTDANGSWTNSPTSFSYQWQQCNSSGSSCTAIAGATNQTYTLTSADVGHTIRVQESATNAGGTRGPVSSAQTPVVAQNASSTALLAVPNAPVTNQSVTLIATVTSSSSDAPPSGAITFENGGTPISGCALVTVATVNQSVNVMCQTSFAALTSPEQLTAVFKPTAGSSVAGSTSATDNVVVRGDSTSTFLQLSNPTVKVGASATYTATVTPSHGGPVQPSGSVAFMDGGKPIASCASQPLTTGGAFFTATCRVTYKKTGLHSITAVYRGDASYSGSSSSPAQRVSVRLLPVQVLGTITSTMQWTFYYTPTYTRILAFAVNGVPVGANVLVMCRGRGCPFSKQAIAATKAKPCKKKSKRGCSPQRPRAIDLVPRFHSHHLALGAQVTIEIVQPRWIGKYYAFTMRARHAPRIQITCLAAGGTRPGVGC